MLSGFLSFGFMDVSSNLQAFFRDVNDNLVTQASSREEKEVRWKQQLVQEQEDHQTDQQHNVGVPASLSNLKLEIPAFEKEEEREKDDSSNDGLKTPTSSEHKIPMNLPYPPAPKKPKPRPSTKRKSCGSQIVLDVSQEIESLFSTPFSVDIGSGGKNKKLKLGVTVNSYILVLSFSLLLDSDAIIALTLFVNGTESFVNGNREH
ncbi:hypothetical protein VNO77_36361 [Canavalia gladiata]|uniref:Uncharacterized protein n=1 Tax=Canavalia gladiata TaxID=3824 RepID=A0AAN9K973_CANGL